MVRFRWQLSCHLGLVLAPLTPALSGATAWAQRASRFPGPGEREKKLISGYWSEANGLATNRQSVILADRLSDCPDVW